MMVIVAIAGNSYYCPCHCRWISFVSLSLPLDQFRSIVMPLDQFCIIAIAIGSVSRKIEDINTYLPFKK